jgi:large subunit ribosomal protein L17
MRHLKAGRKLHIDTKQRMALFKNMVTSLMLHGKIRTTEQKAKEIRRIADRVITLGKRVPPSALADLTGLELDKARAQRVHAIRLARRWLLDREAVDKVFNEYAELFRTRKGGYTRLSKLGFRAGDNAPMNLVELVDEGVPLAPALGEKAVENPSDGAKAPSAE